MNDSWTGRAGRVLREHVDAPGAERGSAVERARLVRAATAGSRSRGRVVVLALAAALVVAVVVGVVALRPSREAALAFEVEAGAVDGSQSSYFAPAGAEPVSLRFSEGSVITLEPSSRARVARTTPQGASLLLESGRARLDIVRRAGADWTVVAGPYTVMVRGTAFEVSWDTDTGTFEIQMERGDVLVKGPGVEEGVELSGTQHFTVREPRGGRATPAGSGTAGREPENVEPPKVVDSVVEPSSGAKGALSSSASAGVAAPGVSARAADVSWAALAKQGEFKRIVEEAERTGADAAIQQSSAADLWALADAARVTGRGVLARNALTAVRSRFPGSARAASAAFLLGRMSDDGGSPAGAIRWYDQYLAEAPGGTFAPEALGRRMVALQRSGSADAARAAAESYLRQFPSGPYAGVAREMASP